MAKKVKSRKTQLGELPPRYTFALNPYEDARFSKCPNCNHKTFPRKFPLLIYIGEFGGFVLGKTCRYCSKCEFIIAHQDELENIMTQAFSEFAPEYIGNDYLVVGTVEKKVWKQRLDKAGTLGEILPHAADFKKVVALGYEPAGWQLPKK